MMIKVINTIKERLKQVQLNKFFPEYKGNPTDVNAAVRFIETKFRLSAEKDLMGREMCVTCATDPSQLPKVVQALRGLVKKENIEAMMAEIQPTM